MSRESTRIATEKGAVTRVTISDTGRLYISLTPSRPESVLTSLNASEARQLADALNAHADQLDRPPLGAAAPTNQHTQEDQ